MSKLLVKNKKVVDTKIDNEVVMMNSERGHYFGLDDIGTVIWEMLDEPMTEAQLIQKLTTQFAVSQEQCARDVEPFVRNLIKTGMLMEADQ